MNLTWGIVGYGLATIFTLIGTLGLHWDKWHKKRNPASLAGLQAHRLNLAGEVDDDFATVTSALI